MDPICCSTFLIRVLCSSTWAGGAEGSTDAPLRPAAVRGMLAEVRDGGALLERGGGRADAAAPAARRAAAL